MSTNLIKKVAEFNPYDKMFSGLANGAALILRYYIEETRQTEGE